ncbi:ABC transporter [Dethiosulfatibacter aminovorans DSM 17477]|uniref:ABC-type quaternary amine transporter n=1 Tax=Dethiosulfatibacter aminovorans DSM 17477 TaxID=1121476 RepID=A0A1M6ABU5_9FIRM|nr:ATP-binding cassette domain-containing protein [Dethiosulfatibacter aminovorans]SHI33962.1 ABC transporter [Dethiosulfatibacter aminovorans DSM 17477]
MLEIKNLSLQLNGFKLKNINLEVDDKEYCVLLGPSGSGKTLMLETIAGLHKASKGQVLFNGRNLLEMSPERRGIGLVYQNYELFPRMTVRDNITFGLRIRKKSNETIKSELGKLMDLFRIEHLLDRYPANLSGGEQQRVALARALIISPGILFLDEPLSSLDHLNKELLMNELQRVHRNSGITIIHVTHDLDEAFFLADKIGVMTAGELIKTETKKEFINKPRSFLLNQLKFCKKAI